MSQTPINHRRISRYSDQLDQLLSRSPAPVTEHVPPTLFRVKSVTPSIATGTPELEIVLTRFPVIIPARFPYRECLLKSAGAVVQIEAWRRFDGRRFDFSIDHIDLVEDHGNVPALPLAPYSSVADLSMLNRLIRIYESLTPRYRQLIDLCMIESDHLDRFLRAPASKRNHHAEPGGLVKHTVDVAERVDNMLNQITGLDRDLAITGAILHDFGKIFEYRTSDGHRYYMTEDGEKVGHKAWGNSLVGAAALKSSLAPCERTALMHLLTATKCETRSGMRVRDSIEADLVATADRASAAADFYNDEQSEEAKEGPRAQS